MGTSHMLRNGTFHATTARMKREMFALQLLQAPPANQSHSRQSSSSAGQKPARPGPRQSHKPVYRVEGEPSEAIRRAGVP